MNSKHETNEPGRRPGVPPEAPRSASALEAFFDWPLGAGTVGAEAKGRLFEDFMSLMSGRRSASSGPSLPWTTPNVVALELPSMQLRDFSTGTDGPATLICAPYALHGATIADFAPDHSVVETLCRGGLSRVFVTDWRAATLGTRYFEIVNDRAALTVSVCQPQHPADHV